MHCRQVIRVIAEASSLVLDRTLSEQLCAAGAPRQMYIASHFFV